MGVVLESENGLQGGPQEGLHLGRGISDLPKTLFESPPKIDLKIVGILDVAGRPGSLEYVASETPSFVLWGVFQVGHFEPPGCDSRDSSPGGLRGPKASPMKPK